MSSFVNVMKATVCAVGAVEGYDTQVTFTMNKLGKEIPKEELARSFHNELMEDLKKLKDEFSTMNGTLPAVNKMPEGKAHCNISSTNNDRQNMEVSDHDGSGHKTDKLSEMRNRLEDIKRQVLAWPPQNSLVELQQQLHICETETATCEKEIRELEFWLKIAKKKSFYLGISLRGTQNQAPADRRRQLAKAEEDYAKLQSEEAELQRKKSDAQIRKENLSRRVEMLEDQICNAHAAAPKMQSETAELQRNAIVVKTIRDALSRSTKTARAKMLKVKEQLLSIARKKGAC